MKNKSDSKLSSYMSMQMLKSLGLNEEILLYQIISNSYDGIFVIDKDGNVLLANPSAVRLLKQPAEEIIGHNVRELIRKGFYNRSTAMEAVEKRTVVTGSVKLASGVSMSTSIPVLDEKGEVLITITNTRDKDLVDTYMAALEQEQEKTERYKNAAKYLGDLDFKNRVPIAESPLMCQIFTKATNVARADSTILLLGESGTGKEVLARHIHRNSPRAKEPLIPVNCAAIPHDLMESEFFGYERGAFSGANVNGKPGFFEMADKGTLFLDEVAELPLAMQSKLLRVLETGEVQRVGGTSLRRTDVRLLAATNKDLMAAVKQNLFRNDLYYRLNVIPITLPPLRDRPEDIIALSQIFLDQFNKKYGLNKFFSPNINQSFLCYNWPGNVRQLRNVIERLVITSVDDELFFEEECLEGKKERSEVVSCQNTEPIKYSGNLKSVLKSVEEQYIQQTLNECGGRLGESANRLGIHRSMLYRKISSMQNKN